MRVAAMLLLLLTLTACASNWRTVSTRPQAALHDGAELVTLERGRGSERERAVRIRTGGEDVAPGSVDELLGYCRPLESAEAAISYAELVRALAIPDAGVRGMVVLPDKELGGFGSSGRYSRTDAAAWGIDFEPSAKPFAGGFEVSHVVLIAPIEHPVLPHAASPWRLLLVREIVFPDGRIRPRDDRTLTNGIDAARFATY